MNSGTMMVCHRLVTVPHYAEHWSEATFSPSWEGVGGWVDKGRSPERAPSGARTLDPNIKSVVLYQLS